MVRRGRMLLLGLLAVLAAGGWTQSAEAAWCGTTAAADRPQVVGGPYVHAVYVFPSDGADRSATFAPTIENDIAQIDAWWRTQDTTRTPRFDLFPFACGVQPDISSVRLAASGAALAPQQSRFQTIGAELMRNGFISTDAKYLVYYDGPLDSTQICGEGGGFPDSGPSYAMVYLGTCGGVPTANIAAHEILHALGAMPDVGPLHPCQGSNGHPCDSSADILYPFASLTPLAQLLLDAGRDDYYGFTGGWFDVQDSRWLRRLDQQVPLTVAVQGSGKVTSLQPGPECTATCTAEWDAGSQVQLQAEPGPGQRLVRWSGACTGVNGCSLTLAAATSVSAVFGPVAFRLTVSVQGKGIVRSTPFGLACRVRCSAPFRSFQSVKLRAVPAKGWRFVRWSGACAGKRPTCTVSMRAAAAARAVMARRRA
jgi:Divergent InlB B-repeat domain